MKITYLVAPLKLGSIRNFIPWRSPSCILVTLLNKGIKHLRVISAAIYRWQIIHQKDIISPWPLLAHGHLQDGIKDRAVDETNFALFVATRDIATQLQKQRACRMMWCAFHQIFASSCLGMGTYLSEYL